MPSLDIWVNFLFSLFLSYVTFQDTLNWPQWDFEQKPLMFTSRSHPPIIVTVLL